MQKKVSRESAFSNFELHDYLTYSKQTQTQSKLWPKLALSGSKTQWWQQTQNTEELQLGIASSGRTQWLLPSLTLLICKLGT